MPVSMTNQWSAWCVSLVCAIHFMSINQNDSCIPSKGGSRYAVKRALQTTMSMSVKDSLHCGQHRFGGSSIGVF